MNRVLALLTYPNLTLFFNNEFEIHPLSQNTEGSFFGKVGCYRLFFLKKYIFVQ